MNLEDCVFGQSLLVSSPLSQELRLHFLNLLGGEFFHWNISYHRDDVPLHIALIPLKSSLGDEGSE